MQSPLSEVVASELRRYREVRGLNREQLADACARYGAPHLTYSALVNIETGRKGKDGVRRRDVTVDELAVLARALGVPPVALLFPVGHADEVEAVPGHPAPVWDALRWFTGEGALPTKTDDTDRPWGVTNDDYADWRADRAGLTDYRWHDRYLEEWRVSRAEARRARSVAARDDAENRAAEAAPKLWDVRVRLREKGLRLPPLPDDLAHIDADGYRPDWSWTR
ncbi:helix-turn-helix domain-containing protein [Streptomyces griseoaurantiacus]|uniref:helix-turn-helix domain-containing protein n=1 Tax=Streptomyces griseoaurantiacus TaxID=68213 RepID=UPI0030E5DAB1